MVDVTRYTKSYLSATEVKEKGLEQGTILTEPNLETTDFGERLECDVKAGEQEYSLGINKTSASELAHAYGNDSKDWVSKAVVFKIKEMIVSGKPKEVLFLEPVKG